MKIIRTIDADGMPRFNDSWPANRPLPARAVEVARLPGPFEDFVDGAWVYDAKGHADALAGPAHIAEARALKYLEALTVLATGDLPTGLIAAEAAERSMTQAALAAVVIAKRSAFIAAEVTRQRRQAGAGS